MSIVARAPQLNPLAAVQDGYNFGRQRIENQQRDQELQRQQAERARLQALQTQVGGMAASGDYRGAQQAALQGGQFDLAQSFSKMGEQERAYALEVADLGYRIAEKLKTLPEASRGQAFANAAPVLVQNYGIKPEQLPKDFSDASLDNLMRGYNLLREQAKPQVVQSGRNIVGLNPQDGSAAWSYELPQDPLAAREQEAKIAAIEALQAQRNASANAANARASNTGAGRRSGGGKRDIRSYSDAELKAIAGVP